MAKEFHVEFDIDNDAFEEWPGREVARILREVADSIEERGVPLVRQTVRDVMGNAVGGYGTTLSGDDLRLSERERL